jgi:hypothetical protein
MNTTPNTQHPLVLTSHPLQRVGAFALAALADIEHPPHPEMLTTDQFMAVAAEMTAQLQATASVEKAADPGGFWLSASYVLWPNACINHNSRGKHTTEKRRELIAQWRAMPAITEWPGVPCAYCDRPACGWYGKVDIPLGASAEHRNTTAPGQQGTPLCYSCLVCLWAYPYGAMLAGGRAAVFHSWDDVFLAAVVRNAVVSTLQQARDPERPKVKPGPYFREHAVLRAVRTHKRDGDRTGTQTTQQDGQQVELIVLSNSNKEQFLQTLEMDDPIARWLRLTCHNESIAAGYATLLETQAAKNVPGEAFLAKRIITDPPKVLSRITAYLLQKLADSGQVPAAEVTALAPLIDSYCHEVLDMNEKDIVQIRELAQRLSALFRKDTRPGPLQGFIAANNRHGDLYGWFRSEAIFWLLKERPKELSQTQILISERDFHLLFADDKRWLHRSRLIIAVMEDLAQHNWRPKGSPDEMAEFEETAKAVNHSNENEGQ